jgi:hypothetical protein
MLHMLQFITIDFKAVSINSGGSMRHVTQHAQQSASADCG